MKPLTLSIACAIAVTLMACASGPNVSALRKAHFEGAPQSNAALDARLAERAPAICNAGDAVPGNLAEPLVRVPPNLPLGAVTSGTCSVRFDVNTLGVTTNIRSYDCTDEIFAYSSRKAASKWKYSPAILNGNAIATCNIESRITFRITDERGKMLPIHDVDERGRFKEKPDS